MPALLALWPLVRRFLPYLAIVLAVLGAWAWADHRGYQRGVAHVEARDAKAAARIIAAADNLRAADTLIAGHHALAEQARQAETRIIRNDTTRIIEKPIYSTVCGDTAAGGLWDRAVAAANRTHQSDAADAAAPTAEHASQP